MTIKKEFNDYTREQIKEVLGHQAQVTDDFDTLPALVGENTDKFSDWIENTDLWSNWYLIPITEFIPLFFLSTGYLDIVIEAINSTDPAAAFLTLMDNEEDNNEIEFDEVEQGIIVSMYFALKANILSIRIYSKYMYELIDEAKTSDDSLLDSVLIDRTVLSTPSVANRIALAESMNDTKFFDQLSKAITKTRSRPQVHNQDSKFLLKLLDESKALNNSTQEELWDFFSRTLHKGIKKYGGHKNVFSCP